MPKIDVAHLNALKPRPKPSDNPTEAIRTPSNDAADPMEVDKVPMGRTLRKRKEKVAKHLKRGANEKERESFQKRVFKIPLEKSFEEAYFTHRLWMFFRETWENKEDIRRMFCEAREKMKKRITLKKKNDHGHFAIPCTRSSGEIVRDLEVQIGNALVPVDFHVLDIKLNWNSSLLLRRAFLSTVGAVCNLQTNQLCLTLIDPLVNYNLIPVKKPQTSSRRIDDPELIAACHCGAEYETEYSASIKTDTSTSIDSARQKSTDTLKKESVDSSPNDWENDYYNPTMAAHTKDTMHTEEYDEYYEKERAIEYKATDITVSTSIDTHPRQTSQKRASTDIAYFPSIDTGVDRVREGDYSIGSWADDHHHESYAVETTIHEPGADELHEGFTYEELLNMQRRDEADQQRSEATGEKTRLSHPIDRANHPSIDNSLPPSIDIRLKPKSTVSENPKFDNQYLTQDEFDNHFKKKYIHPTRPSIDVYIPPSIDRRPEFGRRAFDLFGTRKFYWDEKDEYGVYRDDHGYARDMDGHIISVSKDDIKKLMERASRDEHNYICHPKHASLFTQTKLAPEIYNKDEINEMFYEVCGAQEKYEGDFQMKLVGVYYSLNDSISWLTTCMEEMRQDIAKIQHAADKHRPASIDRHYSISIDDDPKKSHR
ncbi:hypothetical protein F2Q70_00016896 [Brassica cretica]|uniref:Uncharacterized protein n=1 Tax=Brassica cretica TaxID=69181 RepID=A0A8S9I603_BRACR|nr:hypothetical protein F2Q70_00016896 [Brassica cretica]KAF2596850.1 hypothetical protein F2Q68_00009862 [Brassica cretica]